MSHRFGGTLWKWRVLRLANHQFVSLAQIAQKLRRPAASQSPVTPVTAPFPRLCCFRGPGRPLSVAEADSRAGVCFHRAGRLPGGEPYWTLTRCLRIADSQSASDVLLALRQRPLAGVTVLQLSAVCRISLHYSQRDPILRSWLLAFKEDGMSVCSPVASARSGEQPARRLPSFDLSPSSTMPGAPE
jgi:hypothetical protein